MRTHHLADLDVSLVAYCTSQAAGRRQDDHPAMVLQDDTVTITHLPSALHRDVVSGYVEQPGWLPSTEERIDETGEHPVANDKAPGRHAVPWTADRALADALDGLDGVGWMAPRHRDRTFFAGPVPLTREARTLAQWTVTELTR